MQEDVLADDRLTLGTLVLGLEVGSEARAYTLAQIGDGALNDTLNGQALVVFALAQGHTGAEFDAVLDGRRLRFQWDGEAYRDEETGSRWSFDGHALEGPLAGQSLRALPARTAFWFSYCSALPQVTVAGVDAPNED